ncbi:MAG: exodeoxyribonuclease V subunit gamma, partial [Saccharopolyspora sp.]|uniref:exodeoxyribonuclease V subunit gamma n=1 Tax=Saccharopolyspora sp. TaxID=33915 RepID=UPI0025E30D74
MREVINCDSGASAAEQAPEAARPEVEQLRGLQADAAAPGGLALVLRRLSRFVGGPAALLGPDDRSVQVHSCHGPARQIDVLREVLLGLLADDETLEPRDI